MKKRGIAILSFFLLSMCVAYAQSGWVNTPFNSTQAGSNNVTDVFFLNADSGMVITENATMSYLWYTTDGGLNWTQDTFLTKVNAFSYGGLINAWVCGDGGSLYKATLGANGMSWVSQTSGVTSDLTDIYMVNSLVGYTVAYSGVMRSTSNGGTTWSNPIVTPFNYDFEAVHFTSATDGYVVGTQNFFQGFIAKTISGGQYWGTPFQTASGMNELDFPTDAVGYVVGNGGSVYKTINGTSNTPSWSILTTGITADLHAVYFLNADTGFVAGEDGLILKTTDGGSTWQNQSLNTTLDVNSVWMVDYSTVYAGLDSNEVYKTTTSGIGLDLTTADDSVYCSSYVNLQTSVSYNGTGTLSYSWAASPLLSSTTDSMPTAGPLTSDQTFYITVTDGSISDVDSVQIRVVALPTDSVCLVTVDDSIGFNVLVFEQHVLGPVEYYNVYRESSVAGVYDSIGFIPADSAGYFEDTASNPAVQQYSYRISTIDSCGNESVMSNHHTTMHLTVNQGTGSTWNLIWTPYEGIPIITYRIWRADTSRNFALIDSVPGTSTSYSDLTPPSGRLYYQVEIVSPYICQPWLYSKARTNFNTSRSNAADNGVIVIPPTLQADFSANPTSGTAPLQVQFTDQSLLATEWYWDFGDGDTSMQRNPVHVYQSAGMFTVTLVVSDGQDWDTLSQQSFIDVVSSIDHVTQNPELYIYPNPALAGQEFIIEYSNIRVEDLRLIDITGREIKIVATEESDRIKVRPMTQESGVYVIQVRDENKRLHQRKFVIR